jgi:hypothetical protein
MWRWIAGSLLFALACSSSTSATSDGAAAPAFECAETLAEWRAQPSFVGADKTATFAAGSAACSADFHQTWQTCDGPYDRMTWWSFPNCSGTLFYDHVSGELVAVLAEDRMTGDVCGALHCQAGPPQFFAPPATCTTVAQCDP